MPPHRDGVWLSRLAIARGRTLRRNSCRRSSSFTLKSIRSIPPECYCSVVHSVRVPLVARTISIDSIQPALRELDVPVVTRRGRRRPPAVLETPGTRRDADVPRDLGLGA